MISLQSLISRAARHNPAGVATRFGDRNQTWPEFEARIARLAAGLKSLGLADGDRVGLLSLNSDKYLEAMFAIAWAGGVMVPLNTRWALPENRYALENSGATILFFDDNFSHQVQVLAAEPELPMKAIYMGEGACPAGFIDYEQLLASQEPLAMSSRQGEDLVGIFYTGGTTGFPKGVMQCHRALWASAMGALPDAGLDRRNSYLHVAPMFHMADFAISMCAILSCASHVIVPRFDPDLVINTIVERQVTHVMLVPAMIKSVLNHPSAPQLAGSALCKLLYGASPMPAEVLKRCLQLWPQVGLVQAYGQTELAPIVSVLSSEAHLQGGEKLKSAGIPTAINEVRILDAEGNDCPTLVAGEVVVRGPHAMLGYWKNPEETRKTLRNGWVHTGDAGYLDGEGYLFLVDRVKDMIVTGGENVFCTEVENALIGHPAVQDVAVIGIPDEAWGEAVHAVIVLRPNASVSLEALVAHCRDKIAGYKLPKSATFRDEPLPLSGAGKILKTELRKPFWEGRQRQVN